MTIDENILLDRLIESDFDNLVKYLNEEEIYNNTLVIPYPYTYEDAKWWVSHLDDFENANGFQKGWAIRHKDEGLIGCIALNYMYGLDSHKNEIGYWLAKPFWSKGIMTKVVSEVSRACLQNRKIDRIEAPVFYFNSASGKVLQKSGYQFEGILRKYTKKEGKLIDVKMYAMTM